MFEKAPQQSVIASCPMRLATDLASQRGEVVGGEVCHIFAFQVIPEILHRIEFRRISREQFHLQPVRLRSEITRSVGATVAGQAVPHHQDAPAQMTVQAPQEDDHIFPADAAGA